MTEGGGRRRRRLRSLPSPPPARALPSGAARLDQEKPALTGRGDALLQSKPRLWLANPRGRIWKRAVQSEGGRFASRPLARALLCPRGGDCTFFFPSFLSVVVSDDGDDDGVGGADRLPGFLFLAGRLVPGAAAAGRAVRALVLAPRAGRAGRAELLQPGVAFGPGLPGAHEQRALPAGRGPGQVRPPGPLRDPAGHPVLGRPRRPGRLLLPLPTPAAPPRGLPHPHPPPRLGRARLRPRAALRARPRWIPLRRPPRPAARGGRQPRASPPAPRMDPGGVSRAT